MSFLKNSAVRACFFIMLAVSGCVQTQEHSSSERITIDKSLSYGNALDKNAVKARNEIRKNPNDPAVSPWYRFQPGKALNTPEWPFEPVHHKRFSHEISR